MFYSNLDELVRGSRSAREYYLSLPISMQVSLHQHNPYIHSAAELHDRVNLLEQYRHLAEISGGNRIR